MSELEGRTYLVTGSNIGIGKATAIDLARRGGQVVMACRSEEKAKAAIADIVKETGSKKVEFLALDLADLESVRASAAAFLAQDRPLHVLINNAGVAGQRGQTKQGFELTFGVNHLGHFLFTTLLLDRIRESGPGARIVNVSSIGHTQARKIDWDGLRKTTSVTGLPEYGLSKLCNVLFTQELARRLPADEVSAYALHPGAIASNIWKRLPWPIEPFLKLFMKSTEEGAETSLYCATSPDVEGISGRYYDSCKEKEPSKVATPELAAELWKRSEAWVAL